MVGMITNISDYKGIYFLSFNNALMTEFKLYCHKFLLICAISQLQESAFTKRFRTFALAS